MATITTPVRIGPADNGRTMTISELREAEVEEGYRYELERGVLEVTEVPYGLLEYWTVDPLKRQGTLLTRQGDTWNELVVRGDELIASAVLPDFATTVKELWVDVEDELAHDELADASSNGS